MPWVIIIYSCMVFYADTLSHNWGNAVFAGFNAIVTFWAMICSSRSHRNDFRWFIHPFVCFAWISAVPTGVVLHGKSLFMMNWGKTRWIEIQREVKGLCPEHA